MGCSVRQIFATPKSSTMVTLTKGRWAVENESISFDAKEKILFFSARRESHLEKHFFSLSFDPSKPEMFDAKPLQLTQKGTFHDVNIDEGNFSFFTSVFSSVSQPRQ